ncbi:outer membrane protein, partial [Microvirga puerhi]
FTWTGFYVGVNAGYGWNTNNENVFVPGIGFVDSGSNGGFVGGGQIGYNYQFNQFVVGVEGDVQYADVNRHRNNDFLFVTPGFVGANNNNNNDWFGTVRARAGFAFDRALIYATGGFAFNGDNGGWTVGGGVEYAFTNNLTAKVEGLYVNIDNGNRNDAFLLGTPVGFVGGKNKDEFGVIRAGLNYKFSSY